VCDQEPFNLGEQIVVAAARLADERYPLGSLQVECRFIEIPNLPEPFGCHNTLVRGNLRAAI